MGRAGCRITDKYPRLVRIPAVENVRRSLRFAYELGGVVQHRRVDQDSPSASEEPKQMLLQDSCLAKFYCTGLPCLDDHEPTDAYTLAVVR